MHQFKKYTSSILLSLKVNFQVQKVYFKYTSEFDNKYIKFESTLQVYNSESEKKYKCISKTGSKCIVKLPNHCARLIVTHFDH